MATQAPTETTNPTTAAASTNLPASVDDGGFTEADVCSEEDIVEAMQGFLEGDLTLAQLEGLTAEDLYAVADLGYDLAAEGKLVEAQKIFEGLYCYNPFDAYFHAALGSVYHRQGKLEEASNHYMAAVELHPEDLHSWTNLAEVCLERATVLVHDGEIESAEGQFSAAVESLEKAIELDPNGEHPAGLRARALIAVTSDFASSAARRVASA